MTLILMIFYELRFNPAYNIVIVCQVKRPIMFARFICAIILHLSLTDEVTGGLKMMKFAINHPYKFQNFTMAYTTGFMQFLSSLGVEVSNLAVILAANDTISIVFNFIAVAIIAEFDNYVFDSMKNEVFKHIIEEKFTEKVFKITHTTSKKCKDAELSKVKDEHGNRRPLKVTFKSRSCCHKVLFVLYKIMRSFYVSVFYYFLPFMVIVVSTMVPTIYRGREVQ